MSFQIDAKVTCYMLPGDGPVAEQDFLTNLNSGKEAWFIAYAFTLVPMIDELLNAQARGVPMHIYLDHSQAAGHFEAAQIKRLVDAGTEITIGTSPVGSQYICHTKGVVIDVNPPWCWEGSVNFSKTAWDQVNTAMVFNSQVWRDNFVNQFNALRAFAWQKEQPLQIMPSPPPGVADSPILTPSAGPSPPSPVQSPVHTPSSGRGDHPHAGHHPAKSQPPPHKPARHRR